MASGDLDGVERERVVLGADGVVLVAEGRMRMGEYRSSRASQKAIDIERPERVPERASTDSARRAPGMRPPNIAK